MLINLSIQTKIINIVKIFVLLTVLNIHFAKANTPCDTTKKTLIAKLDKISTPSYIIKPANIIFPEILKGNEENSLSYIENFSTKRRDYVMHMFSKGKKYFPKAAAILKKHNIPQEFKVLVAIESAFNANAVSCAGAVGYWQIMDGVAKEYKMNYVTQISKADKEKMMKENAVIADSIFKAREKLKDDRKDFVKSTTAAAKYLKDRTRNLGSNWLLIVASYNCGAGNVRKAIAKSGKPNASFWDIKDFLPTETRNYVMNFIALNVLFNNYEKFSKNTLTFAPEKIMIDNFEQNMLSEMGNK